MIKGGNRATKTVVHGSDVERRLLSIAKLIVDHDYISFLVSSIDYDYPMSDA